MTLFEKIKLIYPNIEDKDCFSIGGTIQLQNDSDGKGDYIAKWEYPTLAQPTQAQLEAVGK